MKTETLPRDDTPTGHSIAAAWRVIWIFSIPAAALLVGLAGEIAIQVLF